MIEQNKPRLVQTGAGFSIYTVEYKNRLLYSKYNPARAIEALVEKNQILPGTLVLVNSPCLFHGILPLIKKCGHESEILCVEDDIELFNLAQNSLEELKSQNPQEDFTIVQLLSTKNLSQLDEKIRKIVNTGSIRRVISLDFSAGKVFNPQMYNLILNASQEIISTFWKNRITLTKMGRLFSKNILTNLKNLDNEICLSQIKGTIDKPILVCGAGESLDFTLAKDGSDFSKDLYNGKYHIMVVDAALTTVLDRGLHVDSCIGLESQFAIQKAYIGHGNESPLFFADLCSRPSVQRLFKGKTVWFMSEFAQLGFLDRLKNENIISDFIPPLGSVGLAAVYLALLLRQDISIPIFVSGLDFSYSIGKTHANFTPAHKARLFSTNRFVGVDNLDSTFAPSASFVIGKNGSPMATTPNMAGYRQNFVNTFSQQSNLFDIGITGLDLGIKKVPKDLCSKIFELTGIHQELNLKKIPAPSRTSAKDFLQQEKLALEKLRDILSNGEKSKHFKKDMELGKQIEDLVSGREYLYLHFPDGHSFSLDSGFLKRIRAEIDFFLKFLD